MCVSTCSLLSLFLNTESTHQVLCASHRPFVTAVQKDTGNREISLFLMAAARRKYRLLWCFLTFTARSFSADEQKRIDKFSNKLVFC